MEALELEVIKWLKKNPLHYSEILKHISMEYAKEYNKTHDEQLKLQLDLILKEIEFYENIWRERRKKARAILRGDE